MKLKDILNESKNNISEAKKVDPRIAGDIFARYLIGDRTSAIKQLDKLVGRLYGKAEASILPSKLK